MYRNILVPVSFEPDRNAAAALDIAQTLRSDDGAITIIHVLEHPPAYASSFLPADHVETARRTVVENLKPLADTVPGAKLAIVEGHPARSILDFAQERAHDCVVVASHQPGMQDLLLGSVAAKIVRHAHCAVHVIR